MKDIWNEVIQWSQTKPSFVIARVIQTWRSAPRKAGAAMLVDPEMNVVGSVSGGCIEGARFISSAFFVWGLMKA